MTDLPQARLRIERLGGIAGFGGSSLTSMVELDPAALTAEDRSQVEGLFKKDRKRTKAEGPDMFTYKVTLSDKHKARTMIVGEADVPQAVLDSIHDHVS